MGNASSEELVVSNTDRNGFSSNELAQGVVNLFLTLTAYLATCGVVDEWVHGSLTRLFRLAFAFLLRNA